MFDLNFKYFPFILLFILFFSACREEIIPPFTPTGNINEPIQQVTPGLYSFTINAQLISDSLIDHTFFTSTTSRLYLSLFDYSSGAAELTIYDRDRNIIYKSKFDNNFQSPLLNLQGFIPNVVQIFFTNFTGKLTIQIVQDLN